MLVRRRVKEVIRLGSGEIVTVGHAVGAVRRVGVRSDAVLAELLRAPDDQLVGLVVVEALVPMLKCRARGDRELLDDLITELLVVFDDLRQGRCRPRCSHLANFLMDTAWDRCRRDRRSSEVIAPVDITDVIPLIPARDPGPERSAVNRAAVVEFDRRVQRSAQQDPVLERSWRDALRLVDHPRSTAADQDRWRYVRKVLRRYANADLVA